MSDLNVIIGLGITGLSCAQHLKEQNIPFAITDSRPNPPMLADFQQLFPDVVIKLGQLDPILLAQATRIILSPGVSLHEPVIAAQIQRGVAVIGDIELFAQAVKAPVIAITGTNAKSTVTTLVGDMMQAADKRVQVGGNLGVPALNLLNDKVQQQPDVFILELSSFQLESTFSLQPQVATILNITPDHMDRYEDLIDYKLAKHRVYQHCQLAVCNRDDALTECHDTRVPRKLHFTLNKPQQQEFGLLEQKGANYLAYEGQPLLDVRELPIMGKHYQANALAALALGHGYGLPFAPMLKVLREFGGLPHRCQFVRELAGVKWYNDSKGTNVGATLAAMNGLGSEIPGKLILIAGGVGKNADFSLLVPALMRYVRHAVLIGEAAQEIACALDNCVPQSFASTMAEAVQQAAQAALPNDSVLLSPACASFDMFKNFEHRGTVFMTEVKKLT
jgi:UDP-N-acetylmuramoylalanine--D-glutamate ligase